MATHELAREPHPPGQSATPRLQPKQPAQPAGFMSAREPGDGDEDARLPDIHARTPSAVLESVSDGPQDDGGEEQLFKLRRVKLKAGTSVNVGRGRRNFGLKPAKSSPEARLGEDGKFGLIQREKKRIDHAAERRRKLIASLPKIENDPSTRRHMVAKINSQLVGAHNDLDRLRQQRLHKTERLRALNDQFADVCRDCGITLPARGKKGKKPGTQLVVAKPPPDPKILRMQSELSRLRRKMEALAEERLSMECMRERMEAEWILSVARLRDRRAILTQHDWNDAQLTQDYLNQCVLENSNAQGDLKEEKRLLLEDGRRRQETLHNLRFKVSVEMNNQKVDDEYEERRKKVIAAQAGDMDQNGEKRLKTRLVTGHFRALIVNNQSQQSLEKRKEIVERLDKIKEITGAKDAENLIVRYEELKSTTQAMNQQKDESNERIRQLEADRERLQMELATVGEFGGGATETTKAELTGFEQQHSAANEKCRHVQRVYNQATTMVSASRLTVQSMLMALKRISISGDFDVDILRETEDQEGLGGWLEKCAEHLERMEMKLPAEYQRLLTTGPTSIWLSEPSYWQQAANCREGSGLGMRVWVANIFEHIEDAAAAHRVRGVVKVVMDGKPVQGYTKEELNRRNVNELQMLAQEKRISIAMIQKAHASSEEKQELIDAILRKCAPTEPKLGRRVPRFVDPGTEQHASCNLREQGDYYYEEGWQGGAAVGPGEGAGDIYFYSDQNPGEVYRHGIEVTVIGASDLAVMSTAVDSGNNWRIDMEQNQSKLLELGGDMPIVQTQGPRYIRPNVKNLKHKGRKQRALEVDSEDD